MINKKQFIAFLLLLTVPAQSWAQMTFDGVDDYVNVPNAQPLDFTSAYTLAAWIKPNQLRGYELIFTRGSSSGEDIVTYIQNLTNFVVGHNRNNGGSLTYWYGQNPVAGVWTHFVVTYDTTNKCRVYYNGVEVVFTLGGGSGGAPLDSNKDWQIGATLNTAIYGATNEFDGAMDDVRFYNRVLSAQEIQSLAFSASRTLITDGLVGHWKLDDGVDGETATGTSSVADSSGNNSHGTPTDSPTWAASTVVSYP